MNLTFLTGVVAVLILGLALWGVRSAVQVSRRTHPPPLTPVQLSGLAQPFRTILGEMLEVWRAVRRAAGPAPSSVSQELQELSARVGRVVARALPRAQYGTRLLDRRDSLPTTDPAHLAMASAAQAVVDELHGFLDSLRSLQGKVYQLLADANALLPDDRLRIDLDEALIDVEALEAAFREVRDNEM